ncbi:MAG: hypothetical protein K0U98_11480 [Deltaproteobacteria bacterium]|nr:hypothetical protein [Deltaproteobacteria bacterium]
MNTFLREYFSSLAKYFGIGAERREQEQVTSLAEGLSRQLKSLNATEVSFGQVLDLVPEDKLGRLLPALKYLVDSGSLQVVVRIESPSGLGDIAELTIDDEVLMPTEVPDFRAEGELVSVNEDSARVVYLVQ